MAKSKIINLGYDNIVMLERVVAVISANSRQAKRLKEEARRRNKLVDATSGRKTRAIIITDSDHVVLSSVQPETIAGRADI